MFGKDSDDARLAASLAGLAVGAAMALALMIHSEMTGGELSAPLEGIGGFWRGLMTFAVVPSFNEATAAWVETQPGWLWLSVHLLYGAVLGALTPPIDRALRGGH